jgi:hypothetical protein
MDDWSGTATQALSRSYIRDYPLDAAKRIEAMPAREVAEALAEQPVDAIGPLFGSLAPDVAADLLRLLFVIRHFPPPSTGQPLSVKCRQNPWPCIAATSACKARMARASDSTYAGRSVGQLGKLATN